MGARRAQWSVSIAVALLALVVLDGAARAAGLTPALVNQILALEQRKASRSPAERKISSHLLYADRMRRGVSIAAGIPRLETLVEVAADGTTHVDIRAAVTAALLDQIKALGGSVLHASTREGAIRARLPIASLARLAERDEIRSISPAGRAFTRKINTSEGDTTHRASALRAAFGVDGSGISVGVLSDGVDSLTTIQGSGDLPPGVTVLPGQAGSGDEGTAMLEIVHDLAPGADLLFATAFMSQASFADNILALQAAGVDVIVDDVGYFAEAVFQDDDVAAAVNTVTAAGVLYFSAAGNGGNLDDGTSGVWEGDFQPTASPIGGTATAHDFGAGDAFDEILSASPYVYTLHWSDPLGGSANDYDLYLVNKTGSLVLGASTTVQDGNDDPFEIVGASANDKGRKLVVVRKNGAANRFLHLDSNRGRLDYATDGQISGHAAARDAFSVAAVDVRGVHGVDGSFDGSESVETYSSDGPRRVFYEASGSEITPGVYGATGGELRAKPDLTAADCVSTATPGFSTFCGTSAAAPHAAAIAALLLDIRAAATPAEIRTALTSGTLDIGAMGPDRDSGAGIVDATDAATGLVECLVDGDCDDGSFCDGVETCSSGSCVAGTPVDPDDGVACTQDACDEAQNAVTHMADEARCDDDDPCTADSCDALTGCGHAAIEGCGVASVPASSDGLRVLLILLMGALGAGVLVRRRV